MSKEVIPANDKLKAKAVNHNRQQRAYAMACIASRLIAGDLANPDEGRYFKAGVMNFQFAIDEAEELLVTAEERCGVQHGLEE
jgi:hypothetical protein